MGGCLRVCGGVGIGLCLDNTFKRSSSEMSCTETDKAGAVP